MPDHFIDALTAETGAVDNGPTYPKPSERRTIHQTANGPVIIRRLPAGDWSCDDCRTQGTGWLDIEAHNQRTGHKVYTETRPPR